MTIGDWQAISGENPAPGWRVRIGPFLQGDYNHFMKKVVHAACPHDCPDACGVLVTVEDGRATRIQGDSAHPVTRGFLCAKVTKYLDRVYAPDRVLYPMRRVAPKGRGKGGASDFVRISWDAALSEIK